MGDQSFKMASDDLLFSSHVQGSFNGGGGEVTTSVYKPGFWPQEEGVAEFKLWSSNGHSDLHELSNCALNSIRSRKNTERNENEEVELQCLVSNILDEGDEIQGRFNNRGNPSIANGLWHPKTLTEDILPNFQPEDSVPNYVPSEALIQSHAVSKNEQFLQMFSGIPANLHSHDSVPNGDRDSYDSHPTQLSPGLTIPQMANHFPPQTVGSNYDLSADLHQAFHRPVNDFLQISDVFQLQNKMSRPFFDQHESVMSVKPISNNEQDVPEHMNQLASGLKSLMADESNQGCYGGFPNIERKTEYPEDSIPEQWKFPSWPMPMFCKKQLEGEFWGRDVKPAFEHQGVEEMSVLGNENAEYLPQIKPISVSSNPPNQYQNIINWDQYSNPCSNQEQYKMKSLMQKEMKETSGCIEERLPTTAHVAETHRRPHVDHLGGMETFNGENIMGSVQPFIPPAHVDSKPRRFTQPPVKSEKDTTPHGSASPAVTPAAMMAVNDGGAALYSHLKSSEAQNGGRNCEDGGSLAALLEMNPGGLVIQFYLHLDECSEELGYLEWERKKTEVILAKTFPGEWTMPPPPPPGLSLNATRLDCLIFYQKRELANVEWLLYKMECACNVRLHASIGLVLNNHQQALSCVRMIRGEELTNASKDQQHGTQLTEDHDTLPLVIALKELTMTTKNLRRGLWCAAQMAMRTPTRSAEERATTSRERRIALWRSLRMAAPTPVWKTEEQSDANREETRIHSCPYSVALQSKF
ncbi:uncharacterized protein moto isoform X2 [Festucalex cinctus]